MPTTLHPAVLAIAAVIGIGFAIYSIFSENQERCHDHEQSSPPRRPRSPPPSERTEQYDTHPNRLKGRKRVDTDCKICSICLEQLSMKRNIKLISCAHSFHYECLRKWVNQKRECPQCRQPIPWHAV